SFFLPCHGVNRDLHSFPTRRSSDLVANFILAIAIFTFLFSIFGSAVQPPVVGDVMEDTPAAEAGFQPGDRVLAIGGRTVESFERSEEHTSELQSRENIVCRLLLEKK